MALLKEDGSLNIEWLDSLPLEEHLKEIGSLNRQQYKEYIASIPINEGKEHTKAVSTSRSLEDLLASGYVNAIERINNIGKETETNNEIMEFDRR